MTFTSGILFFVIMCLACNVSGLVGFGSNILALPFLSLFLDVKTIVPVLIVTILCNSIPRLVTQYKDVNLKIFLIMLPLAGLGGIVGIHIVSYLHEGWMKLLLSIFLCLIALKGLFKKRMPVKKIKKQTPLFLIIPFLGGCMQAAFACGGPLYNTFILLSLDKKEQIRATMFAIGASTSILVAGQYLFAGVYRGETLQYLILMLPAVLIAYIISEKIFRKINGEQFLKVVYVVMLFASFMTAWQAIKLF